MKEEWEGNRCIFVLKNIVRISIKGIYILKIFINLSSFSPIFSKSNRILNQKVIDLQITSQINCWIAVKQVTS